MLQKPIFSRGAHNFLGVVLKGAPGNAAWYSHFMHTFILQAVIITFLMTLYYLLSLEHDEGAFFN